MDKKSRQTLRERVVVHISDVGGDITQDKLLDLRTEVGVGEDEAFIEQLEGMVQDGLIRWDGAAYSLHSEGRKLAARVKKKAGIVEPEPAAPAEEAHDHAHPHAHDHAEASPAPAAPAAPAIAPAEEAHDHAHPHAHDHAPPAPPPPPTDHGHSHDHGGGHGHSHDHGGDTTEKSAPPPPKRPRPAAKAPAPPPPKAGLRAFLKTAVKRILGLDR